MDHRNLIILIMMAIPLAKGAVPGTFFWKPRLGIDLAIPTTQSSMSIHKPSKQNMHDGFVTLVDGYQAGLTVVGLTVGLSSGKTYPHLSPTSAFFYTQAYRWGLRYFSMIPFWIGGHGGHYVQTHKVWKRRFYYMDEFVPKWLRYLFPYVDKAEWAKEEWDWKRFKKYSEAAFGKHYRYPTRVFKNFQSEMTVETIEGLDSHSSSEDSQLPTVNN